jgi:dolichol-phosphate mannosyltransferase
MEMQAKIRAYCAAEVETRFSVVVPLFNEEGNLLDLHQRLLKVMESLGESFEIIFVDDGSSDRTLEILHQLHREDERTRAIALSRNFGHQRAVTSGLVYASGQAVIVMDGDLQDPPEVIPNMVSAWRQGYEVVYAVRRLRPEGKIKRTAYNIFYRLMSSIANIDVPLDSGDFSLMDRRVVDVINSMPERNRFVRGLRAWVGFRQTGIEYQRSARNAGESKYSFGKLVNLALDGLISHSFLPLRLVSFLGIFMSFCALAGIVYVIACRLIGYDIPAGWTSLLVTMLFLGGVQLLALGILGEYLGRTFEEVKQRPQFVVRELLGLSGQRDASDLQQSPLQREAFPLAMSATVKAPH